MTGLGLCWGTPRCIWIQTAEAEREPKAQSSQVAGDPQGKRGSWKSAQETLDVETPGSLPDSYASELDSTSC